jgi:Protein of unknown function DUF262
MQRDADTYSVEDLAKEFPSIQFPEYQREPNVWNLDQKQRLIDSILRGFDIAAIYLYEREDKTWECIDGRQRLNAIMSFLGKNPLDPDNAFSIRIHNEIADEDPEELRRLYGQSFDQLDDKDAILKYEITTIVLAGTRTPTEFNLQFLRLNLGTLINAGEKLHAMVGVMRNKIFGDNGLGQHPFLAAVGIPTRRYSRETLATQLMLQVASRRQTGEYTRGRHFDLQRYLKQYATREDPGLAEVTETLDALHQHAPELGVKLGNRAIAVSVVLAGLKLGVRHRAELARSYGEFVAVFLERLQYQVGRMKEFDPDPDYDYLVTFQRHLTQAAVEKPALAFRDKTLVEEFEKWAETGQLTGDGD